MKSLSFCLFLVGCSSTATITCDADDVCARYGARCVEGTCRVAHDVARAPEAELDLASAPAFDAARPTDAPDLREVDLAPGCLESASCSTAAPVCGADRQCRACVAADREICAGRDVTTPRCDESSGACAACRPAQAALDCPDAARSVCVSDGSCRQACARHADCASGICDPRVLFTDQATCARPEEIVHVRNDAGCSGAHAGTEADPACTIDDAVALRPAGGFIRVHAGGAAQPRVRTRLVQPYVLIGDAVLVAPDETVAGVPLHRSILGVGPGGRVHLEGLWLRDAHGGGIVCEGGRLSLASAHFYGDTPAAVSARDCDVDVTRSRFEHGGNGIEHDGGRLTATNTFINDNAGIAVVVGARSSPGLLAYLTIASNDGGGKAGAFSCGTNFTVWNSILFENRLVGGRSFQSSCAFRSTRLESVENGIGNTTLVPQFTPGIPLLGVFTDYHLQSGMPYAETVPGAEIGDDYDGQARPQRGAVDIGADEW